MSTKNKHETDGATDGNGFGSFLMSDAGMKAQVTLLQGRVTEDAILDALEAAYDAGRGSMFQGSEDRA